MMLENLCDETPREENARGSEKNAGMGGSTSGSLCGAGYRAGRPLILASGSPRRRELLSKMGISLVVDPSDADESAVPGEDATHLAPRLARAKGESAARKYLSCPGTILLAADTIVTFEGRLLGKPRTEEEAAAMLRMLSGHVHSVFSGVWVRRIGISGSGRGPDEEGTAAGSNRPFTGTRSDQCRGSSSSPQLDLVEKNGKTLYRPPVKIDMGEALGPGGEKKGDIPTGFGRSEAAEIIAGGANCKKTGGAAPDCSAPEIDEGFEKTIGVETRVQFRALTEEEIRWYVATGEPMDKAGAYAIQGIAGAFVAAIEGSHSNVIGLPLAESLELLSQAGLKMPWETARSR